MKKQIIIGIIILVILIAGAFFFLRSPNSADISQNTNSVNSKVEVTTLAQAVYLTEPNASARQEVVASTSASYGSTIATGAAGRALLEESSRRLVLDFNSQVTLAANEGDGVNLGAGAVWARVEKVAEKGQFSEIETKNAVAAVRGTYFGVSYLNSTTILFVTEGAVWFAPKDPNTGEVDETKAVIVTAGKKAVRIGNGAIIVSDITEADKLLSWYVFNNSSIDVESPNGKVSATSSSGASSSPRSNKPNTTPGTPSGTSNGTSNTGGGSGGGGSTNEGGSTNPSGDSPNGDPNPNGANSNTSFVANVQGSPLFIKSVTPSRIKSDATEMPITLMGHGFQSAISLYLNKIKVQDFSISDDGEIVFSLELKMQAGVYDITVVNSAKQNATLKGGLTLY